ncbi:leucine-rich repeat and IQ domain-containing protein 4-like [Branchiostoma lanceolatum]|uniref:leucine-rich repeat and IQ domain-containing protein 4-like n=1 Tax=Branchiostoma lanceolatum TaxID=7740 RepID=UPI003451F214
MDDTDRTVLKKHTQRFVDELQLDDLFIALASKGVLDFKALREIKALETREDQVTSLLQMLMTREGDTLTKFSEALMETDQGHLAELLDPAAESNGDQEPTTGQDSQDEDAKSDTDEPAIRTFLAVAVTPLRSYDQDFLLQPGDEVLVTGQEGSQWTVVHGTRAVRVDSAGLRVKYELQDFVAKPPTTRTLVRTLSAHAIKPHQSSGPYQLKLDGGEEVQVIEQLSTGGWTVVCGDGRVGRVDPACLKITDEEKELSLREQMYTGGNPVVAALNLQGRALHSLPDELFNLTEVQHLYIADNLLTSLPEDLVNLSELVRLDANRNKLRTFPEVLLKMSQLEDLNLGENGFNSLPSDIGKLIKLKKLWLKNLNLTTLPIAVCFLRNLRILNLHGNSLNSLDDAIVNLGDLTTLDASNNQFVRFPKQICALTTLQRLYMGQLHGNKFKVIPDGIANLTQLKVMAVDNNALTSLPASIGQLENLETLHAHRNKLTAIPDEICALTKLQSLWLHGNVIRKLPKTMDRLVSLQDFRVEGNPLSYPPMSVCKKGFGAIKKFIKEDRELNEMAG